MLVISISTYYLMPLTNHVLLISITFLEMIDQNDNVTKKALFSEICKINN